MLTRSIRWRFLIWLAFLLVIVLSGFGITAYQLHLTNQLAQIDAELSQRLGALRPDVRDRFGPGGPGGPGGKGPGFDPGMGPFNRRMGGHDFPPRGAGPGPNPGPEFRPEPREGMISATAAAAYDAQDGAGFYFALWSRGGTLLRQSTNAPASIPIPEKTGSGSIAETRMRGTLREAYRFALPGDCLLVGRDIAADLQGIHLFAWWLAGAGVLVLALGLGGAWLLATRAIRPVEAIGAAAARISAGNLSERISVAETDSELGRLAQVLNSTFARLESAFALQKQFIADASHELRTPIAVIISEAQTTLQRDRDAAEYRETIGACLDAAQEMRRLTHALLELARLDAGQEPLERKTVDLASRARACLELIRPLAAARGLELSSDLAPAPVTGDEDRLGQVLTNLLSNAIHYNREHGRIAVTTRMEAGESILEVSDTGIGIPEEDVPRVFERFYRADKARGRADGRSGLGLAICKVIVEGHGGRIEVRSKPGTGTTFIVRFPTAPSTTVSPRP